MNEKGLAWATFAGWAAAIEQAWQRGAVAPAPVVSDGDQAVAASLAMV